MTDSSMVNISQLVEVDTKNVLNKLTRELEDYALENGLRKPKKGEVLSKLVKVGAKNFNIPGYFKS